MLRFYLIGRYRSIYINHLPEMMCGFGSDCTSTQQFNIPSNLADEEETPKVYGLDHSKVGEVQSPGA